MNCPCDNQCREECDICRDTDTMNNLDVTWVKIECPKCGHVGNYSKTVSGRTKCSNCRCKKLLWVGKK